jgi:hypothetical protein
MQAAPDSMYGTIDIAGNVTNLTGRCMHERPLTHINSQKTVAE